ncbi:Uncharacterized protein FWK35_00025184 [Aphis craccivora]|uniref:Uncharacterized protein n=1 Tax=Aphis craccivora TaxID=307492 RepID=A0A6G0YMT4_APHCR|nr:Uncharacterized protein FWK35_00025184 [Aphis craccivora]
MKEVIDNEINNNRRDCVYIPHSYVVNEDSRTTKLRVSSTNYSGNVEKMERGIFESISGQSYVTSTSQGWY